MNESATPKRKQKQKKNNATPITDVNVTDILLGRGKSFKNHPGNVRFQEIINSYREEYFTTKSHREKREYTTAIVESICEEGRFLKRDKNAWTVASFETARQKVAHAMQYRQRCLLNNTYDSSEEIMDDNETWSNSVKYGVQKSDVATNENSVSTSSEAGWLPKVRKEVSTSRLSRRTSNRVKDMVSRADEANENNCGKSSIEAGMLARVDVTSQAHSRFLHLEGSAILARTKCLAKSSKMGLNVPNATHYQPLLWTPDLEHNQYSCSSENDAVLDLVRMSTILSQAVNATIGKYGESQPISSDEQLSTDIQIIPPPINNLLRETSDFSFGDFSLDGEFMSNIDGDPHQTFEGI